MEPNKNNIATRRLCHQHVDGKKLKTPAEVVSHMGAMQAQDFAMVKWALGARLPGTGEDEIMQAFNAGKIIRTHLLRPTWHLVIPDDIYALLHLTAPRIRSSAGSRHRQLEIDEKLVNKCNDIFIAALRDHKHKTREELMKILESKGVKIDSARASHLMFCAELDGIVCSGEMRNKQQTYALLEERVPPRSKIDPDEALVRLSSKYFSSHGPASAADFSWWSGLPLSMARKGIEMIKKELAAETYEGIGYWSRPGDSDCSDAPSVHLLPAFDEFLISYRDRSAALNKIHHPKAVSNNGIFRPIVVINGQIEGIWKKTTRGKSVILELSMFSPLKKKMMPLLKEASEKYADFLNMNLQLTTNN